MNVSPLIEHLRGKMSSSSHPKVETLAPLSGETMTIFLQDAAQSGKIVKVLHVMFFLNERFNFCNSFPFFHLLRKRTLRAIGIIPHTKVLVNLEQALLVRDSFQELFPARIVSEKTRRPCFQSAVR
jgi:hypothetical protein